MHVLHSFALGVLKASGNPDCEGRTVCTEIIITPQRMQTTTQTYGTLLIALCFTIVIVSLIMGRRRKTQSILTTARILSAEELAEATAPLKPSSDLDNGDEDKADSATSDGDSETDPSEPR